MEDPKIFTENFSGNLDELNKFTQDNADFVLDVINTNQKNPSIDIPVTPSPVSVPVVSGEQLPTTDESDMVVVTEELDKMVAEGLLEVVSFDDDGEPRFQLTEKGKGLKV